MLDNILHKHLDAIDSIKEEAYKDVDAVFNTIDIKSLIKNTDKELNDVIVIIRKLLLDRYIPSAMEEGVKLSNDINNDEEIIIQDSTNPNLNKEAIND
jgi:hypothetical protein